MLAMGAAQRDTQPGTTSGQGLRTTRLFALVMSQKMIVEGLNAVMMAQMGLTSRRNCDAGVPKSWTARGAAPCQLAHRLEQSESKLSTPLPNELCEENDILRSQSAAAARSRAHRFLKVSG